MTARFILSFDCEGKWGSADELTRAHRRDLTDQGLRDVYALILALLDEYAIEATFAFVGIFSQSAKAFSRMRPKIEQLAQEAPAYLRPALDDIDDVGGDGWHGDALVAAVADEATSHEIALHGVTHVPWASMDRGFAETEMLLFEDLEGPVRNSKTFVYPRNRVAHTDVLAARGFAGFRAARPKRSRLDSLLSEFNIFEIPEQDRPESRTREIPAGFFLNWRNGFRRLVPSAVTRLRARRLLDRAAVSSGVVHYWLHPENIATAPSTFSLLRALVEDVARARDAGNCEVLTQLAYCRSFNPR